MDRHARSKHLRAQGHLSSENSQRPFLLWLLVFLAWVLFMWGHSLVQGDASSQESLAVVNIVRPLFELFNTTDIQVMTHVVRKCAHFLEYAVMGVLLRQTIASCVRWRTGTAAGLDTWCSCAVWACVALLIPSLDETLQLFVPGRSGQITDVVLDFCGALAGLAVAHLWHAARARRASRPA
ncbi:MAG: VanZ family protein [Atopobiaceae bacterium]